MRQPQREGKEEEEGDGDEEGQETVEAMGRRKGKRVVGETHIYMYENHLHQEREVGGGREGGKEGSVKGGVEASFFATKKIILLPRFNN